MQPDRTSAEYKTEVRVSLSSAQLKLLQRLVDALLSRNSKNVRDALGLTTVNTNLWRSLGRKLARATADFEGATRLVERHEATAQRNHELASRLHALYERAEAIACAVHQRDLLDLHAEAPVRGSIDEPIITALQALRPELDATALVLDIRRS